MKSGSLYYTLDKLVARLADTLGVRITRARPIDFSNSGLHPVAAYYVANGRPVVFDAPLERLRGLGANAFPCHGSSIHPYVLALTDYANDRHTNYEGSALERFHHCCQPATAAEHLGIEAEEEESRLARLPPEMAVLPWQKENPDERLRNVQRCVVKEQKQISKGLEVSLADWHEFGPMSAAAGSRDWRRLLALYRCMARDGYRRSPRFEGDVAGQVLVDDRETSAWSFLISVGGQHRAGAAGALGYSAIPVRLVAHRTPLILRSHAPYWPHVRSGLFTVESALRVFDRIVAGRQPFPWAREVRERRG